MSFEFLNRGSLVTSGPIQAGKLTASSGLFSSTSARISPSFAPPEHVDIPGVTGVLDCVTRLFDPSCRADEGQQEIGYTE